MSADQARPFPAPARDAPAPPAHAVVIVRAWSDPLLDRFGHDPRSPYVERFWLPIVGPSGTMLLRRLAGGFDDRPEGYRLDLTAVAQALGMGRREGPSASFRRTLERVASFGFIEFQLPVAPTVRRAGVEPDRPEDGTLVVRRRLPGLTRRQQQRLPRPLRDDHDAWLAAQPTDEMVGARVQHLAASLLELGEDPPAVEDHLLRLDFHPAVVQRALRTALDRATGGEAPACGNDAA
jgi:hypothetical protein